MYTRFFRFWKISMWCVCVWFDSSSSFALAQSRTNRALISCTGHETSGYHHLLLRQRDEKIVKGKKESISVITSISTDVPDIP